MKKTKNSHMMKTVFNQIEICTQFTGTCILE